MRAQLVEIYEGSPQSWIAFLCACWLAGAGGDARTSLVSYGFCGGRRYIISMAEGRSFGRARRARKGPHKQCIFPKSDALLDIGVLTREKKGEKRCESSESQGMHHFVQKSGGKGVAAGARFRADPG